MADITSRQQTAGSKQWVDCGFRIADLSQAKPAKLAQPDNWLNRFYGFND